MSVNCLVSAGEALDKLSILDIKLKYIKDERRIDVQNERNCLMETCKELLENKSIQFFYSLLVVINENIWKLQDDVRDGNKEVDVNVCNIILDENDRRFRVKRKINNVANSFLKEQKGYAKTRCLLVSHLGMGDILNMIQVANYLATKYDQVMFTCKKKYATNAKMLMSHDSDIVIKEVDDYYNEKFGDYTTIKGEKVKVYSCGLHKQGFVHAMDNIPECFYKDMGLDINELKHYMYFNKECTDIFKGTIPFKYAFVSDTSSVNSEKFFVSESLKNKWSDLVIINPNRCVYDQSFEHYEFLQTLLGKPLMFYISIIEGATKVVTFDSSFLCIANLCNLSGIDECLIFNADDKDHNYSSFLQPCFKLSKLSELK
jgi:hypothetical protein